MQPRTSSSAELIARFEAKNFILLELIALLGITKYGTLTLGISHLYCSTNGLKLKHGFFPLNHSTFTILIAPKIVVTTATRNTNPLSGVQFGHKLTRKNVVKSFVFTSRRLKFGRFQARTVTDGGPI